MNSLSLIFDLKPGIVLLIPCSIGSKVELQGKSLQKKKSKSHLMDEISLGSQAVLFLFRSWASSNLEIFHFFCDKLHMSVILIGWKSKENLLN